MLNNCYQWLGGRGEGGGGHVINEEEKQIFTLMVNKTFI
jgi:hypothetical protein